MNLFGYCFSKPGLDRSFFRIKPLYTPCILDAPSVAFPILRVMFTSTAINADCNKFIMPSPIESVQHVTTINFSFISPCITYLNTIEHWSITKISWAVSIKIENISDCFI